MVVGRVTFTMVLLMMLTNLPVGLLFEPFQSSSMTCSCTFVCSHSAKIVRSVERNIIILVCSVGCSTQGCLERGGGGGEGGYFQSWAVACYFIGTSTFGGQTLSLHTI